MIKDIWMRKKYFFIIPLLFLAIVVIVFNYSADKVSSDKEICEAPYKTDKQPIVSCFPKLGEFEKCYWKSM